MPEYFFQHWWACAAVWAALFIADYAMTIRCARLYRSGVNEKFVFEGSFELTPMYQKDIDELRTISPRFLAMLVLNATLLVMLWALMAVENPGVYSFFAGAMIGTQMAVHIRHLRNYVTFRMAAADAVRGRIEYSRPVILKSSAAELMATAVMFGVLGAMTMSWFPAGAAFGTAAAAWKHYRLARKASRTATDQTSAATAG